MDFDQLQRVLRMVRIRPIRATLALIAFSVLTIASTYVSERVRIAAHGSRSEASRDPESPTVDVEMGSRVLDASSFVEEAPRKAVEILFPAGGSRVRWNAAELLTLRGSAAREVLTRGVAPYRIEARLTDSSGRVHLSGEALIDRDLGWRVPLGAPAAAGIVDGLVTAVVELRDGGGSTLGKVSQDLLVQASSAHHGGFRDE